MDVAQTKEKVSSLTVKLENTDRDRLKSLAVVKKRTSHFLMKEAIQKYLEAEEAEQRFVAAARAALADFKKTGRHITLDEFGTWTRSLAKNPKEPMPVCHK